MSESVSPNIEAKIVKACQTPELDLGAGELEIWITKVLRFLEENLRKNPRICRDVIEETLREAAAQKCAAGQAWLRFYQAWLCVDADDYDRALEIATEARDLFEEQGNQEGFARITNAFGAIYALKGVWDLAFDHFKESAETAEEVGRKDLAATSVLNMGDALVQIGEFEEALRAIERCRADLPLKPFLMSSAHTVAGKALHGLKRLAEGEAELQAALNLAGERMNLRLDASVALAELLMDAQRLEEAAAMIQDGFEKASNPLERSILARLHLSRARLKQLQGNPRSALQDAELGIAQARHLGALKTEAAGERIASEVWRMLGDDGRALEALNRHLALRDAMRGDQTARRIAGLQSQRAWREAKHFELLYRKISMISDIGRRITSDHDFERILGSVFDSVNGIMHAPTLMVVLLDDARQSLEYRLIIVEGTRLHPIDCPLDMETLAAWTVRHQQDVVITGREEGLAQTFGFKEIPFDAWMSQSMLFVPIFVGDQVAGVISVQSSKFDAYRKQENEMLRAIGAYLSVALENARLFQQLQTLASMDSLTGLNNRRKLTETIAIEFRKSCRYRSPGAVIMVDIDHFKHVNDRYGHSQGDAVIQAMASVFSREIRECDAVGRWGGEEFVILLPGTGLEGAMLFAERLRAAIENLRIRLDDGQTIHVTASLGVSCFRPQDAHFEAAINRADRALYHSKEAGRNRVSGDDMNMGGYQTSF